MMDGVIDKVFADRGSRGHDYEGEAEDHLAGKKKIPRTLKKWLKRRNAIESIIGHLKSANGLDRNYLKEKEGERINSKLAACGANFRKILRAILFAPEFIRVKIIKIWHIVRNIELGVETPHIRVV